MLPLESNLVNSLLSVVGLQVVLWRLVARSSPDRIAAPTWVENYCCRKLVETREGKRVVELKKRRWCTCSVR